MAGLRLDRPWGWELVWEVVPTVVGRVFHIRRGHRFWLERGGRGPEQFVLCWGLLMLVWEDARGRLRETVVHPGHIPDVPAAVRHRMIAVEDVAILAITPASLLDALRIDDNDDA
jgi:hypothetical protein